jgi:single-strand DNA-binding protein
MSAQVTVIGNLTKDPELRFTKGGDAVAAFTVAVNERIKDGNDWKDGDPSFYEIKAWRNLGEQAAEHLTKGTRVIVSGKMKIDRYEANDGSQRQSTVITADEIGSSIRFKEIGSRPVREDVAESIPF